MALTGQWFLLFGFAALLLWTVMIAIVRPQLRAVCAAIAGIALTHVIYYWLFLVWPHVLDGQGTMLASIIIRVQVLCTLFIGLGIAVRYGTWR